MRMTRRMVLGVALGLLFLSILVPPWHTWHTAPGSAPMNDQPAGYHLLFSPPTTSDRRSVGIDWSRLGLQGLLILIPGAVLYRRSRPE
jgi:hypothetical protein